MSKRIADHIVKTFLVSVVWVFVAFIAAILIESFKHWQGFNKTLGSFIFDFHYYIVVFLILVDNLIETKLELKQNLEEAVNFGDGKIYGWFKFSLLLIGAITFVLIMLSKHKPDYQKYLEEHYSMVIFITTMLPIVFFRFFTYFKIPDEFKTQTTKN